MPDSIKFDIGGMWEFREWEVQLNVECSELGGGRPCGHCTRHTVDIQTRYDCRRVWARFQWTCPRVIVQHNEAGHSSTGICLDCVLEAFADA